MRKNKFQDFVDIVRTLRRKCPWDREQTIESLKPYLVEEVYEALQAIDDKSYSRLAEELGDMLLHIVMLSVFAEEDKKFNISDVIDSIMQKMIRRHPHVFGNKVVKSKEEVWSRWEKIKQEEVKEKSGKHVGILESIPRSLPALYRADKMQRRAARVGFDWDYVAGAWEKVYEELGEINELLRARQEGKTRGWGKKAGQEGGTRRRDKRGEKRLGKIKEEVGDLLFAITNVARKLNIDAEDALQQANNKFNRRFSTIEDTLKKKKCSAEEMDVLWEKAKKRA